MLQTTCIIYLIVCLVTAVIFIFLVILLPKSNECKPSITTAHGSMADRICSGNLIFVEHFNELNKHVWQPEMMLVGNVSFNIFKTK